MLIKHVTDDYSFLKQYFIVFIFSIMKLDGFEKWSPPGIVASVPEHLVRSTRIIRSVNVLTLNCN